MTMAMANLWLSLLWLVVGAIIGALAAAARLERADVGAVAPRPLASRAWVKVAIGAVAAVVGGWLGIVVFGRLFSTATALWVSALCAMLLPWLLQRGYRRTPKPDTARDDTP
jgi:hypothetical protein